MSEPTLQLQIRLARQTPDASYWQVEPLSTMQTPCQGCGQKTGCQSLSPTAIFLANRLVCLRHDQQSTAWQNKIKSFKVGETEMLNLSSRWLFQRLLWLWGLPLLIFILSIVALQRQPEWIAFVVSILLAVVGAGWSAMWVRHQWRKKLWGSLQVTGYSEAILTMNRK